MTIKAMPALPDDCVYDVFRYLSAPDLARAARTCSTWNKLAAKNSLWQQLCLERWRTWPAPAPYSAFYDSPSSRKEGGGDSACSDHRIRPQFPPDQLPNLRSPKSWYSVSCPPYGMSLWKDVYRERCDKDDIVRMLLEEIVEDSRNRMRHMDGIADVGMVHARDVLENIIAGRNGEQKDLSRTYYARKTLRRLQRGWVLDQWRAYRSNQQSFPIWQGCGLMAMFSDHEMELSDVDRQFESLAQEFLAISPLENSQDHGSTASSMPSIYGSASSVDRFGQDNINAASLGHGFDSSSAGHARQHGSQVDRLKELIRFFTLEKGFKGNTENYYDPLNSFIDKVLVRKVGIPISLCVVFAELAQRVGIAGVELMGFPQHFMIRYRPREPTDELRSSPGGGATESSPARTSTPETYYLDLFHPPYRLLSTDEYEDYFTSLSIPQPPSVYRDLPTPPLEIFLRCLRNIILAVEQTGGAGRIGSDHQTSLYSGITQLLALHPSEEWGLYVLWLKYLSNFWPEDIGFVRIAIEDMELTDHRRSASRSYGASNMPHPHGHPRTHHVYAHGRGGLSNVGAGPFTSSTQETIKILRAQVRELEMTDEAGDVGHIRRRRRPKAAQPTSVSSPPFGHSWMASRSGVENGDHEDTADSWSNARPTVSSPTIDSQLFHAHHQSLRHNSVAGEHQSRSMDGAATSIHDEEPTRPSVVMNTFGGEERRRPEPEYYVGEVFRHLIYRYTGVIYGYNLKCEAEEGWIRSMGIDSLTYGRHQPFYNALLSDGSRRYVAQENIQVMFRDHRRRSLSIAPSLSAELSESPPRESQVNVETNSRYADTDGVMGAATSTTESDASAATTPETLGAVAAAAVASELPVATAATSSILSATSFTLFNLQFSELGPLGIEAVGQYFESWDGDRGHYVMNKELRKVYPTEDYL
ncbi:hypothetical protein BGZ70_001982 [Mortierella alpina]|uniref:F-box domain-containing protein n=1 Tax=Mortierella alpina TaxID=64518 RepID=A0A9P6IVJ0_MORAP|nr:hypothetical protein BGZ70_001982 [Mortierella alpina]